MGNTVQTNLCPCTAPVFWIFFKLMIQKNHCQINQHNNYQVQPWCQFTDYLYLLTDIFDNTTTLCKILSNIIMSFSCLVT